MLRRLASPGRDRTAVFLEAAPRLGLAVARALLRDGWRIVPLYGRWPVEPPVAGVLSTEPLAGWLAWLAGETDPVRGPKACPGRPLCLLLDGERHRPVSRRALWRRFDNRYEYAAHMLPPAERLLSLGVRRTQWVGPAAAAPVDLEVYVAGLIAAGIEVDFAALPLSPARRMPGQ